MPVYGIDRFGSSKQERTTVSNFGANSWPFGSYLRMLYRITNGLFVPCLTNWFFMLARPSDNFFIQEKAPKVCTEREYPGNYLHLFSLVLRNILATRCPIFFVLWAVQYSQCDAQALGTNCTLCGSTPDLYPGKTGAVWRYRSVGTPIKIK